MSFPFPPLCLSRSLSLGRFAELARLLDPSNAGPPKTDKVTLVTEASRFIQRMSTELASVQASGLAP